MKRKNKPNLILIYAVAAVILLPGIFILWKKTGFGFLTSAAGAAQKKVSSFFAYTGGTFSADPGLTQGKKGIRILAQRNLELNTENSVLKAENEKLKKSAVLRQFKDFKSSVICQAYVIGANDDGFIYYYTIDRGGEDSVSEGDGVVAEAGVVGRIVKVSPQSSLVQLLTDAKSNISAKDERSRVTGILAGESFSECSINYVPKDEDVAEGDTIVTSGLGKSFPEGIKIGKVIKADKKVEGLSMDIKVKPFADIFSVEEVLVIKKR
jgi:rod shape-determining protein MreC